MYRCTVYHGTAAICISIELYGARVARRRMSQCASRRRKYKLHNYVDCEQKTDNEICIIAMLCTVCSTLISGSLTTRSPYRGV